MDRLRICLPSSEVAPYAKTGGLADVSASLAAYLHQAGHDVRVFMPLYSRIDPALHHFEPVGGLEQMAVVLGGRPVHYSVLAAPLTETGARIYFIHCPRFYDRDGIYTSEGDEHLRYALLCRAAIESCQHLGWAPDVFHCNDWHTALIPLYLRTLYQWDQLFASTRTVLTIHNIGYQGVFGASILGELGLEESAHLFHQEDLQGGRVNFLKTGVLYADVLTTVSPTYAREIQTEALGFGLEGLLRERSGTLIGILNGVDYSQWSPEQDPHIPVNYSLDDLAGKRENKRFLLEAMGLQYVESVPVLGVVSRLTRQKGFDLLFDVLSEVLRSRDVRLTALGSGEPRYEDSFAWLQRHFPHKVCFYRGYNNRLAHLIEAGADIFLMPSLYEPCGLNQMYSLRYGTIPVVRKTGGLADSVELYDPRTGSGTGLVFDNYDHQGLRWAVNAALDLYQDRDAWRQLVHNAMSRDYSWDRQGAHYVELYRRLTGAPETQAATRG